MNEKNQINVRLEDDLFNRLENIAAALHTTKSYVLRQALQAYLNQNQDLDKIGAEQRRKAEELKDEISVS